MIDIDEVISGLSENCRVLIKCEHGQVVSVRIVGDDEHIATLNALIDLAKSAGYKIVTPNNNRL
ncbi:hypothetical protein PCO87_14250 [Pectobacteriaceae bacterium C52]|nr:hypothetical protein PCO87_13955 [Pectobacteriaceae bacterium C52]WJV61080.1 hypothetical protein PCO87_14250 [Pectobacteriaceae bacterium C52]WJY13627.1 hypothetical protein PCO82_13740 [Pectobacteriaceae bacterium CE90]